MRRSIENAAEKVSQSDELSPLKNNFSADDELALIEAAANSELEDLYDIHLRPIQISAWNLAINALARYGTRIYSAQSKHGDMLPNAISTGWVELSSETFSGTENVVPVMRLGARVGAGDGVPDTIRRVLPDGAIPSDRKIRRTEIALGSLEGLDNIWVEARTAATTADLLPPDTYRRVQRETYFTKRLTHPQNKKYVANTMDDIGEHLIPDLEFYTSSLPEYRTGANVDGAYLPRPSRRDALFRPVTNVADIDTEMSARRTRMAGIITTYEFLGAMEEPLRNNPLFKINK